MSPSLATITADASTNTFHPGALDWSRARTDAELAYLSQLCFETGDHDEQAVAYVTKELAMLAEIERHVSAVLMIVLAQIQAYDIPLAMGNDLHHALSCFAAEEMQHANAFYQYVRHLSGMEPKLGDNRFVERLAVYEGPEPPLVKLAALCCSAYIGESVITVFERRTRLRDPDRAYFLSELLWLHGLDEARHVQIDHFVFERVIAGLSPEDRKAMDRLLEQTGLLNFELNAKFTELTSNLFGLDYTEGNIAYQTQMHLTLLFMERVLGGPDARPVDEVLTDEDRAWLRNYTGEGHVHRTIPGG